MIVIDDGSTDNTRDVVSSYISKFENRGYKLKYYYQNNSGQSVAINNGLKIINGEYIVWPDSDDYYASKDSLQRMVNAFEHHSEVGVVRTQENLLRDKKDEVEI